MQRKPKKKQSANRSRVGARPSGGAHPLLPQVKALINPFDSTPGAAKHLVDPMPSQAYKLKARSTITVAASKTMVGLVSPAFGDLGLPNNYPSAIFMSGSGSELAFTFLEDGLVAGSDPIKGTAVYSSLAPIRPYGAEVSGTSFRLVSYGIRIRYTGTALNANGTIKYLPNDLAAFKYNSTTTNQALIDYVNGNNHTIMRSVYDKAVYDFSALGSTDWAHERENSPAIHDEGSPWGETLSQTAVPNHWGQAKIGENSSSVYFGIPGMLFTYTNNSTSSVQFEMELIENWEARTAQNTAFQTDSHGNPEVSQEVFRTVVAGHMHAAASSVPDVTKSLKAVNAASKSPLGKLVIAAALG